MQLENLSSRSWNNINQIDWHPTATGEIPSETTKASKPAAMQIGQESGDITSVIGVQSKGAEVSAGVSVPWAILKKSCQWSDWVILIFWSRIIWLGITRSPCARAVSCPNSEAVSVSEMEEKPRSSRDDPYDVAIGCPVFDDTTVRCAAGLLKEDGVSYLCQLPDREFRGIPIDR